MIVVRMCGGLGNQLFQYAAARRLADYKKTELVLDLGWYTRISSADTQREYELHNFPIRARPVTVNESLWCRFYQDRLLRRMTFLHRRWVYWREESFEFDSKVLNLPNNVYLDGYWQSESYFTEIADRIRDDVKPLRSFCIEDEKIAAMIAGVDSVSVHVRRGDYVTNQAAANTHGQCSLDYYNAAITYILSRVSRPHFFIFSDDPNWAQSNLTIPGLVTFVNHNGPRTAYNDMQLMSLCKHQIIANSSFSWWAAWKNEHPSKIIVAPKQWFSDNRRTSSLIPDGWIRL